MSKLVPTPQGALPKQLDDTFRCERLRCVLKARSCLERQDATQTWGNHGTKPMHRICQGCPQGALVRASTSSNVLVLPPAPPRPAQAEPEPARTWSHEEQLADVMAGMMAASTPSWDLFGNVDAFQGAVAQRIWAAELSGEPLDLRGLVPGDLQETKMQETPSTPVPIKPACSVAGCVKPVRAQGRCDAHYQQLRRTQAPKKPKAKAKPEAAPATAASSSSAPQARPEPQARPPVRPEDLTVAEIAAVVAYARRRLEEDKLLLEALGEPAGQRRTG